MLLTLSCMLVSLSNVQLFVWFEPNLYKRRSRDFYTFQSSRAILISAFGADVLTDVRTVPYRTVLVSTRSTRRKGEEGNDECSEGSQTEKMDLLEASKAYSVRRSSPKILRQQQR